MSNLCDPTVLTADDLDKLKNNVTSLVTGPMGPVGMPGDTGIQRESFNYTPTVWHTALHKQLQDTMCSKDELLNATFLGEWTVTERDGMAVTTTEWKGKTYLLNIRPIK